MPFSATVYNVLIASPADVPVERSAIAESLYDWNSLHSQNEGIVLQPVKWETHSAPSMGDRPQGIINNQVVRNFDMLIGAFWTRLGSPTGVEDSGTVEEIKWFLNNKKPVMLYYSKSQIDPDSIDIDQYQQLKAFKDSIRNKGIQEQYHTIEELKQKLSRHLLIVLREMKTGPVIDKRAVEAARASTKEDSAAETIIPIKEAGEIHFEDYTDKAFIVKGNTLDHKDELRDAGGRWITCRDKSKAWMFSKKHLPEVARILGLKPSLVSRSM